MGRGFASSLPKMPFGEICPPTPTGVFSASLSFPLGTDAGKNLILGGGGTQDLQLLAQEHGKDVLHALPKRLQVPGGPAQLLLTLILEQQLPPSLLLTHSWEKKQNLGSTEQGKHHSTPGSSWSPPLLLCSRLAARAAMPRSATCARSIC